jgi:hypothetical protein
MDCLLELQRHTHTFLLFIDLPFWKLRKCEQLGKRRPDLYQTQKSIAITLLLDDATCENIFVLTKDYVTQKFEIKTTLLLILNLWIRIST